MVSVPYIVDFSLQACGTTTEQLLAAARNDDYRPTRYHGGDGIASVSVDAEREVMRKVSLIQIRYHRR